MANAAWAGEHASWDGSERAVGVVLGGTSDDDFRERIGKPRTDLEARRDATLPRVRGTPEPDPELCERLRPGSELAHLAASMQKPDPEGSTGAPLLLFVSPEKLALCLQLHAFLRKMHDLRMLGPCVVDEFHCIVEHGYDFRPVYLVLGAFVRALSWVLLLFSATAPPPLVKAVCTVLRLPPTANVREIRCKTGSLRPQMAYQIVPVASTEQRRAVLSNLLARHAGECVIVYCTTRAVCEALAHAYGASFLSSEQCWSNGEGGIAFFHAGINSDSEPKSMDKEAIRRAWGLGTISVMFCTIAWGMGMDKGDVRAVIHWGLPKSIEAFYQEASRAGRDGAPAASYVFFDLGSWIASAQQRAGCLSSGELGRDYGVAKSLQLLEFLLEHSVCRHRLLENALGDGSADHLCICAAAGISLERRCPACHPCRPPTFAVSRCEWVPALLHCAALSRRVALRKGATRPPLLGQLIRSWRHAMRDRWELWQCDVLFAHALCVGVFTLIPVPAQRPATMSTEVGGHGISTSIWVLTAVVHASGHHVAFTAPALEVVHLSSLFDPAFRQDSVLGETSPEASAVVDEFSDFLADEMAAALDAQDMAQEDLLTELLGMIAEESKEETKGECTEGSEASVIDSEETDGEADGQAEDEEEVCQDQVV